MKAFRLRQMRQFYATIILIAALLLQAFIPHGFMPNFDAENAFELSICRSADLPTSNDQDPQSGHSNDMACAFMVASIGDVPEFGGGFIIPHGYVAVHWPSPDDGQYALSRSKDWQAQAPPQFS